MKVKWLGHASFLITSGTGTRIITDPYVTGGSLSYGEIKEPANIITVSHEHYDHNNVTGIPGNPEIVTGTRELNGIKFRGIPTYHDEAEGKQRGNNTILCFEVDGVRVCHLGDLGHVLSDEQVTEVGEVDLLLLPVGGLYTIDARAAGQISDHLKPGVIIPMHFRNERCDFPISGVDDFLQGKNNVTRLNTSEVEFTAGELPASTRIMVLKPAL